jgi:uracil-DNA glycosylase
METALKIGLDWQEILQEEIAKPYFENIMAFIQTEIQNGKIIHPKSADIFNAFNYCTLENLKVVLLGQDPYHGAGQAHGLCFSVNKDVKIPPSLVNIFKELKSDLDIDISTHGCLTQWANQGILMINSSLTVEENLPMSHAKLGWEIFTDSVIKKISDKKDHIVFILWGGFARKKKSLINIEKHTVIESAHPSPLSVYNGFWGSKPFSKTNEYLKSVGKEPINWQLDFKLM